MSDIPQGPGWWQASDGKWYPRGQASLQPLSDHRHAAARPVRNRSEARALVLLVLLVAAVAGYLYGPRYYPQVREWLGLEDAESTPSLTTLVPEQFAMAASAEASNPARSQDPQGVLETMADGWSSMSEADRRDLCNAVAFGGIESTVRAFRVDWAEVAPGVPVPPADVVAQFVASACAQVDPGG